MIEEHLKQLAETAGVALEFRDIWNNRRAPSEQTLRSLLTELGVLPAPSTDVEAALTECERAQWSRVLPPVTVVRGAANCHRLRINLPATAVDEELSWRIREERGGEQGGAVLPRECGRVGEREFGGVRYVAFELEVEVDAPNGYHTLEIRKGDQSLAAMPFIVTPDECFQPRCVRDDARIWGPAVQLYAVHSERNWGIGDFADLRSLMEIWSRQGADIVGLNPLHALFPGNAAHASPYSPSSRVFLNVLYLDVEAIADFRECDAARRVVGSPDFQSRLAELRQAELVDYPGVSAAKVSVLELLYASFREQHLRHGTERARAFLAYQSQGGRALHDYAAYEALYEYFRARDNTASGWQHWPEPFRRPDSPDVAAFADANRERIEFFQYLQWQADKQFATLSKRADELGMGVGLYLDLAVSVARDGADTWCNRELYATGASVGAPPDDFNSRGQNWGLAPLLPQHLRAAAYAPFIAALRANMRGAGALRIDHVMGLLRMFWIPAGSDPSAGTYVYYPFDELLGIVALESQRNRCAIIGEDLGTVPDAVRSAMRAFKVLSYRPLLFERNRRGDFKAPAEFMTDALVAVTTHDLPTLAGYWIGRDLAVRAECGLDDSESVRRSQVTERAKDRGRLLSALEREGLLPGGPASDPVSAREMDEELARAVHAYLARTPAKIMMVQCEDVVGAIEQINLPGAGRTGYPSWRRRYPLALEHWPSYPPFLRLAQALRAARGAGDRKFRPDSRPAPAD